MVDLLVLQPTPFCNIACTYCYLPARDSTRRMSLDTVRRTITRLREGALLGPELSVVWHAGEPLVVPLRFYRDAFELIDSLLPPGCVARHSVQTNATLLDDDWCAFIKAQAIQVGVSLDGPAFIHDRHRRTRRGQGTHASVMRGVARLRRHNIEFHVIAVLTGDSLHHPDQLVDFFLEEGLQHVGFNVEEAEGVNLQSSLQGRDVERRYRTFMQQVYKRVQASGGALRVREFDWARRAILTEPRPLVVADAAAPRDLNHQVVPFGIVSIDADGNFSTFSPELLGQASAEFHNFVFGNVWTHSFDVARLSPAFQVVWSQVRDGVARCRETCEYFSVCGGGAPANKLTETGSLASSETMYCRCSIQTPIDMVLKGLEAQAALG